MQNSQLLEISLQRRPRTNKQVVQLFSRLAASGQLKVANITHDADWTIGDFSFKGHHVTAAYSELQESVRILALRFDGAKLYTVNNTSPSYLENLFCFWAQAVL